MTKSKKVLGKVVYFGSGSLISRMGGLYISTCPGGDLLKIPMYLATICLAHEIGKIGERSAHDLYDSIIKEA